MKAITPSQAKEAARLRKIQSIPSFVIEAINSLLIEKVNQHGYAKLYQDDIIAKILEADAEWTDPTNGSIHIKVDRNMIFEKRWLDFEDLFNEVGWHVTYDQPGYNESYTSCWEFQEK